MLWSQFSILSTIEYAFFKVLLSFQHVVQEVIGTNQTSSNMEGVGLVGAGLNLMPQIGQVQYIQETENGQIMHYQLHDQYGQILQQDQGQTQV